MKKIRQNRNLVNSVKLSEVDSMLGNDVNPPYHFCQNHQSTLELDSTVSRNSNSVVDNFSICQIDFFSSMQYFGRIKNSLDDFWMTLKITFLVRLTPTSEGSK